MIAGEFDCTRASRKAVLLSWTACCGRLNGSLWLLPASLLLQLAREACVGKPAKARGVPGPNASLGDAGHTGTAADADLLATSISRPSICGSCCTRTVICAAC